MIHCTLDGTTPDMTTEAFGSPVQLNVTVTGTVINCIASAHAHVASQMSVSQQFRIKSHPPIFQPNGGAVDDQIVATMTTMAGAGESTIFYHYVDSLKPDKSADVVYDPQSGIIISITGTILTAVASEKGETKDHASTHHLAIHQPARLLLHEPLPAIVRTSMCVRARREEMTCATCDAQESCQVTQLCRMNSRFRARLPSSTLRGNG
jgi:hypothetical protein